MDDDLVGRLVANAGVDCTAAEMADSSALLFLLKREPSRRRALVHRSRGLHTQPPGKARSVRATAQSPAVGSRRSDAD
jgi:hypothetical protein